MESLCRTAVAHALLASMAFLGCGGGSSSAPPGATCAMNSECAQGLTCSFGRCQSACKEERDCPTGQQCVKNASGINSCLLPTMEACHYNSDCQAPLICGADLKCRNQCQADRDCATATQKCVLPDGVCAEPAAINSNGMLNSTDAGLADGPDAEDAAAAAVRIISFTSAADSISAGHSTTLVASFVNGTGVVDHAVGTVTSGLAFTTGSLNETTTYTLTVTGEAGGVATAQVTVHVLATPVAIASGLIGVTALAVHSANVYWISGIAVMKVPTTGGDPITLTQQNVPTAIAVDDNNVYWSNYDYTPQTGSVMKIPLAGGNPVTLAQGPYYANSIAIDANNVYWTGYKYGDDSPTGSVMKVPLTGGDVTTLAQGQSEPGSVAVDDTSVYWNGYSTDNGGSITKVALAGGVPVTLALGLSGAGAMGIGPIAVSGTGVYWGNSMTIPLTGKVAPVSLSPGGGGALGLSNGIALDGTSVYWVSGMSVMKVAMTGGTPITVGTLANQSIWHSVQGIAVDDTSVYLGAVGGANSDSAIVKFAK